jgi:hypothetical protein
MTFWFRPRIRHPFFPGLAPTPARDAKGRVTALCGSFAELEEAAARGVSAKRVVFVLMQADTPLKGLQRDRLWDLFQTPIYAMLLSADGRIAAFECEAQSGFHTQPKNIAPVDNHCECGRSGPVLEAASVFAGVQQHAAFATMQQ